MKTLRLLLSLAALLAGMPVLRAQVVTTQPVFFQDTTPITLTFDATQGNGALAGFTGPVYIWTGVITNLSTSPSDWKYSGASTTSRASTSGTASTASLPP